MITFNAELTSFTIFFRVSWLLERSSACKNKNCYFTADNCSHSESHGLKDNVQQPQTDDSSRMRSFRRGGSDPQNANVRIADVQRCFSFSDRFGFHVYTCLCFVVEFTILALARTGSGIAPGIPFYLLAVARAISNFRLPRMPSPLC